MAKDRVKDVDKAEKPKEEAKKEDKPKRIDKAPEVRNLVRIANTDINADKVLINGIRSIKGVSYTLAKTVCSLSGLNPQTKISELGESGIGKIESILKDPIKYGVYSYLVNRRKDLETGKDMHLIGSDLDVANKFDVQKYVDLRTYRGVRHMLGQPVRGQRTRSSFRQKGRVVGVMKKAIKLQAAAAKPAEEVKK